MARKKQEKVKDDIFKKDVISVAVRVTRKTPLSDGRNAMYMHFGGGSFETDTHKGYIYNGAMGCNGPIVTIQRKDEPGCSERHYVFDCNDLLAPVLVLEGSKGDARQTGALEG